MHVSRRQALFGIGGGLLSSAALTGCGSKKDSTVENPIPSQAENLKAEPKSKIKDEIINHMSQSSSDLNQLALKVNQAVRKLAGQSPNNIKDGIEHIRNKFEADLSLLKIPLTQEAIREHGYVINTFLTKEIFEQDPSANAEYLIKINRVSQIDLNNFKPLESIKKFLLANHNDAKLPKFTVFDISSSDYLPSGFLLDDNNIAMNQVGIGLYASAMGTKFQDSYCRVLANEAGNVYVRQNFLGASKQGSFFKSWSNFDGLKPVNNHVAAEFVSDCCSLQVDQNYIFYMARSDMQQYSFSNLWANKILENLLLENGKFNEVQSMSKVEFSPDLQAFVRSSLGEQADQKIKEAAFEASQRDMREIVRIFRINSR